MMKKVYYLNAETFTYAGLAKAILKSINLASEENMPVAIVVSTTSQFVLLDKIFPKDSFKSKCFRDSTSNITFHLHTFKTYSRANFEQHVFVPICLSEKELIKFEDEWNAYYWVVVPDVKDSILSWLKINKAQDLATDEIIHNEFKLDKKVQNAIGWLKATSYPNEGFCHPLDMNRLKCMANAVNLCNLQFDYDAVLYYCLNNGINHDGGRKIAEHFSKAAQRKYKTDGNYPLTFLKEMMNKKH